MGFDFGLCPPLRMTPRANARASPDQACHSERVKHHSAVFCESNPTIGGRASRGISPGTPPKPLPYLLARSSGRFLSWHIVVLCRNHRLLRGLLMPGTSLRKNAPPARFSLAHLRPSPSFHSGFDSPDGSLKMTRGTARRGYSLPFTLSVGYAATSPKG